MEIKIVQAPLNGLPRAQVNIVIDVIRAFTVAHYAFQRGAQKILMACNVEEALSLKQQNPKFLLCGEILERLWGAF